MQRLESDFITSFMSLDNSADIISKLSFKYSLSYDPKKYLGKKAPVEVFKQLLEAQKKLNDAVSNLDQTVKAYTNIRRQNNDFVIEEHMRAANVLQEVMSVGSAFQTLKYINSQEFLNVLNIRNFGKLTGEAGLIGPLKRFMERMDEYIKITDKNVIFNVLMDESVKSKMQSAEIAQMLCQFDAKFIAEYAKYVLKRTGFSVTYNRRTFDMNLIDSFLANDQDAIIMLNRLRAESYVDIYLPPGCVLPGKSATRDTMSDIYQLYQYEEPAIYAVENLLMNEFSSILVNNFVRSPGDARQVTQEGVSNYFYLVPSAEYVITDPEKQSDYLFRYKKFQKDIRGLVENAFSLEPIFGKPIIVCGIMNVEGQHYLPYFLRMSAGGHVACLTVDPSPCMYPEGSDPKLIDSKLVLQAKLRKVFNNIFSDCSYVDANITQMLRERDCGPNSATTLRDVFRGSAEGNPVVQLDGHKITVNKRTLSVCHEPVGVNTYNNMFVYSSQLDIDAYQSRLFWQERLMVMLHVHTMTIRRGVAEDAPLYILDAYHKEDQMFLEFSYKEMVHKQQKQDNREVHMSQVHSLLIADEEGNKLIKDTIAAYKNDLIFPSSVPIANFVKKNTTELELKALTACHGGSVEDLSDSVVTLILFDYIPEAIKGVFNRQVIAVLPNDRELYANDYMKEFVSMYDAIFRKLTIAHANIIKNNLFKDLETAIRQKHTEMYNRIFMAFYQAAQMYYLVIPAKGMSLYNLILTTPLPVQFCMLHEVTAVKKAIDYLQRIAPEVMQESIRAANDVVARRTAVQTMDQLKPIYENVYAFLSEILKNFTEEGEFVPLTLESLSLYLYSDSIHGILTKDLLSSQLGVLVLPLLQKEIHQYLLAKLNNMVQFISLQYMREVEVQKALVAPQNMETATSYVHVEGLILQEYESLVNMRHFFEYTMKTAFALTEKDYKNVLVRSMVSKTMTACLHELYKKFLMHTYNVMLQSTLSSHHDELVYIKLAHNAAWQEVRLAESFIEPQQTLVFEHFMPWFKQQIGNLILKPMEKMADLHRQINILLTCAGDLKVHLEFIQKHNMAKLYEEAYQALTALYQKVTTAHLLLNIDNVIGEVIREVNQWQFKMADALLNRHYKSGSLVPQQYTTIVRPYLCSLLGIRAVCVLTADNVTAVENSIQNKFISLRKSGVLPRVEKVTLAMLPFVTVLEDTYGKEFDENLIHKILGYWYSNQSKLASRNEEPNFLHALIDCLEDLQFRQNNISPDFLRKLKMMMIPVRSPHESDMRVFKQGDVTEAMRSAILRSRAFTDPLQSNIQFNSLARKLQLREVIGRGGNVQANPQQETQLQNRIKRIIRDERRRNPDAPINMQAITEQAMNEMPNVYRRVPDEHPIASVQTEPHSFVRSRSLLSGGLFGMDLSYIEKEFLAIKRKHAPREDFCLDQGDIDILARLLEKRWHEMMQAKGTDEVMNCYLYHRTREDNVYVLLAEVIAKHFRSIGQPVFTYHLLMPGCQRFMFIDPAKLLCHTFPPAIMEILGDNTLTIDDIPLANLVIIPSGYALDIEWVIRDYQKTNKLINPYTGRQYSPNDLEKIAENARCEVIVKIIESAIVPHISPQAIEALVNYLNSAIFDSGFSSSYKPDENVKAYDGYVEFNKALLALPPGQREALLNESIPGEEGAGSTVKQKLVESEGKRGEDKAFHEGQCATLRGVYLARVVIAYRGSNHGLTNQTLVNRAMSLEAKIKPRVFIYDQPHHGRDASEIVGECEYYLVNQWHKRHQGESLRPKI